jgi:hypothetical protein
MADYIPLTPTGGNLRGICPDCEKLIYRRVSREKMALVCSDLEVAFPSRSGEHRGMNLPLLNLSLHKDKPHHGEHQDLQP